MKGNVHVSIGLYFEQCYWLGHRQILCDLSTCAYGGSECMVVYVTVYCRDEEVRYCIAVSSSEEVLI